VPPRGYNTGPPHGYNTVPPHGYNTVPPHGYNIVPPHGYNIAPPHGYNIMPPHGYNIIALQHIIHTKLFTEIKLIKSQQALIRAALQPFLYFRKITFNKFFFLITLVAEIFEKMLKIK